MTVLYLIVFLCLAVVVTYIFKGLKDVFPVLIKRICILPLLSSVFME